MTIKHKYSGNIKINLLCSNYLFWKHTREINLITMPISTLHTQKKLHQNPTYLITSNLDTKMYRPSKQDNQCIIRFI